MTGHWRAVPSSLPAKLIAIDPGTTESAWVVWDGERIHGFGIEPNADLLARLSSGGGADFFLGDELAIEMIASYGMAVGREVFETCVWIGRFVQAWSPRPHRMVYRRDVKIAICGSARATDPNIRQELLDRIGPQGTKKAPGPTYGLKSHAWAALGVAVTVLPLRNPGAPRDLISEQPERETA